MTRLFRTASEPEFTRPRLHECQSCGLLQSIPALAPGISARCSRCTTTLHRARRHPLEHSLALTLAALVLLGVMCVTTLMSVETAGISHQAGLFSGPEELVQRGMTSLAVVVVFVTVGAPLSKLLGTLYVLLGLRLRAAAASSAPGVRAGRAAHALVDDRGLRLRRAGCLREAGRPGDDHARHRRLRAVRPDIRHDVGRRRTRPGGGLGRARPLSRPGCHRLRLCAGRRQAASAARPAAWSACRHKVTHAVRAATHGCMRASRTASHGPGHW